MGIDSRKLNPGNYDDMLKLPHHVSSKRAPMSMRNRAAQFAPFAALTGYDAVIAETARLTESKPDLTEEQQAILSEKLNALEERIHEQPETEIHHFVQDEKKEGGARKVYSGRLRRIDAFERKLIFTDGTEICFENIYEIR